MHSYAHWDEPRRTRMHAGFVAAAAALVNHAMEAAGASNDHALCPLAILRAMATFSIPMTLVGGALVLPSSPFFPSTPRHADTEAPKDARTQSPASASTDAPNACSPCTQPEGQGALERPKWPRLSLYLLCVLVSAFGTYSVMHVEYGFLLMSLWGHTLYTAYGFLAAAAALTVATSAGLSILCTCDLLPPDSDHALFCVW